jgi:signal peptidase I
MNYLTAALYGALLVYLGGWYMDRWIGNFSLLLLILSAVTFLYWLAERFRFKPAREAAARQLETQDSARRAQLSKQGITQVDGNIAQAQEKLLAQPWWLDWTAGLFPVIIAVFLLRSFLFEPFKIPSGSMIPTLEVGDLILVNKFHYGIRLPVINTKVVANHDPARGDVVVFHYPVDPRIDYIKRVVGLPGDEIRYGNHVLRINGQVVPTVAKADSYDYEHMRDMMRADEQLGDMHHTIQRDKADGDGFFPKTAYPFRDQCSYSSEGVTCKVPAGHYFVMGDNRDNSEDSRYWGFVPDQNLVGRAFFIWMNFGNLGRFGSFQ